MGLLCEVLVINPGLEHRETREHSSRLEGSFTRAKGTFTIAHDGGESTDKVLWLKWRMILKERTTRSSFSQFFYGFDDTSLRVLVFPNYIIVMMMILSKFLFVYVFMHTCMAQCTSGGKKRCVEYHCTLPLRGLWGLNPTHVTRRDHSVFLLLSRTASPDYTSIKKKAGNNL